VSVWFVGFLSTVLLLSYPLLRLIPLYVHLLSNTNQTIICIIHSFLLLPSVADSTCGLPPRALVWVHECLLHKYLSLEFLYVLLFTTALSLSFLLAAAGSHLASALGSVLAQVLRTVLRIFYFKRLRRLFLCVIGKGSFLNQPVHEENVVHGFLGWFVSHHEFLRLVLLDELLLLKETVLEIDASEVLWFGTTRSQVFLLLTITSIGTSNHTVTSVYTMMGI